MKKCIIVIKLFSLIIIINKYYIFTFLQEFFEIFYPLSFDYFSTVVKYTLESENKKKNNSINLEWILGSFIKY